MKIWNEAYNQDWLELKQNIKEDEVILLVPVKIKTDQNGNIMSNRSGGVFDYYKKEIQKLEVDRMIRECNEN
ncbi:hypothetical protein FKF97_10570 [Clostridium perfringens]|nr:hypothetical protein [Clostridium perfringens]